MISCIKFVQCIQSSSTTLEKAAQKFVTKKTRQITLSLPRKKLLVEYLVGELNFAIFEVNFYYSKKLISIIFSHMQASFVQTRYLFKF